MYPIIAKRAKYFGKILCPEEYRVSKWFDIAPEQIDVDKKTKEVNLYITNDDDGSLYVILTFDQIKELYDRVTCNDQRNKTRA